MWWLLTANRACAATDRVVGANLHTDARMFEGSMEAAHRHDAQAARRGGGVGGKQDLDRAAGHSCGD